MIEEAQAAVAVTKSVLTILDLADRWQAPGKTPEARRRFAWRKVREWGVPYDGDKHARFQLRAVMIVEQRRMGK